MCYPQSGLLKEVVIDLCKQSRELITHAAIYESEVTFLYTGMENGDVAAMRNDFVADVDLVNKSLDSYVLDEAMQWVRNIQYRALQDLVVGWPDVFYKCWKTTVHELWADTSDNGFCGEKTLTLDRFLMTICQTGLHPCSQRKSLSKTLFSPYKLTS